MDVALPPAAETAPPPPSSAGPRPGDGDRSSRLVGGVAATIGARLGVDALWVRITFVLLALAGGLGLLVYAGAWLALVAGERPTTLGRLARVAGGVVLVAGVPLALNAGSFELMSGQGAVVALLAGLTLALWGGRRETGPTATDPLVASPWEPGVDATDPAPDANPTASRSSHPPRAVRPRSILGQAVLGLAIATAAVGGLIDELNGGRAHPEQWLGSAAAVCGAGLIVGAFRGRARWLVVPAAGFAAAGYVTGVAASVGVPLHEMADDRYVWIGERGTPSSSTRSAFGDVSVEVRQTPASPATFEATIGVGDLQITRTPGVVVRIVTDDDQEIVVAQPDPAGEQTNVYRGSTTIGEGEPDLTIDATIRRGTVRIQTIVEELRAPDTGVAPPPDGGSLGSGSPDPLAGVGALTPVGAFPGLAGTADGWIVLGESEALLDPDDVLRYETQPSSTGEDGTTRIQTMYGEYVLLPRSLVLAPDGQIIDLVAVRAELAARAPAVTDDDAPPGATTTTTAARSADPTATD